VERATRRFLAWAVVEERSKPVFEGLGDAAPPAKNYYSDQFAVWQASWYPGVYEALPNKSQTYSVEGDNSELRHYLARLARQSRCFSRSLEALSRAVDIFACAWNARQQFKHRYKRGDKCLPAQVTDFI
jgi:insertion element IS1 protein InsB